MFDTLLWHVRQLPVTLGCVVVFGWYFYILHHIQLAGHNNLASIWQIIKLQQYGILHPIPLRWMLEGNQLEFLGFHMYFSVRFFCYKVPISLNLSHQGILFDNDPKWLEIRGQYGALYLSYLVLHHTPVSQLRR